MSSIYYIAKIQRRVYRGQIRVEFLFLSVLVLQSYILCVEQFRIAGREVELQYFLPRIVPIATFGS
jgi:hypothetical protein